MISGFKAAIFDMDGTLLDSMRQWRFAALEYIIANNLPTSDELMTGAFMRGGAATVRMAYELAGIDTAGMNISILEFVKPHYLREVKPKANAIALLKKLKNEGVRCCVATATPKEYALEALKVHGMDKYFEFIFDESDAGCGKANEQYFEKVLKKLGCDKSECVMFEDALYSIRTCKRFGLKVIAIEDKYVIEGPEAVKEAADHYIRDFGELL